MSYATNGKCVNKKQGVIGLEASSRERKFVGARINGK